MVTLNKSYAVLELMDQSRKQIGIKFEEDDETTPFNYIYCRMK